MRIKQLVDIVDAISDLSSGCSTLAGRRMRLFKFSVQVSDGFSAILIGYGLLYPDIRSRNDEATLTLATVYY